MSFPRNLDVKYGGTLAQRRRKGESGTQGHTTRLRRRPSPLWAARQHRTGKAATDGNAGPKRRVFGKAECVSEDANSTQPLSCGSTSSRRMSLAGDASPGKGGREIKGHMRGTTVSVYTALQEKRVHARQDNGDRRHHHRELSSATRSPYATTGSQWPSQSSGRRTTETTNLASY